MPNVKNVQALTVYEVASEINRLIALGTAGKLGSDDLSGGTFSLSNIGTVRSLSILYGICMTRNSTVWESSCGIYFNTS